MVFHKHVYSKSTYNLHNHVLPMLICCIQLSRKLIFNYVIDNLLRYEKITPKEI